MTSSPFQLKSTLGRSYRVDLDDTRRTKEALLRLGYFKTPRYGLTQYPDEPLFAAIEALQQDNGLGRDGIMRPDGETAIHIGHALAGLDRQKLTVPTEREDKVGRLNTPRGRASKILSQPNVFDLIRVTAEGLDNDPKDIEATKRALGWAGYYPSDGSAPDIFNAIRRFQSDHGLEVDGFMRPRGPTARTLDQAITNKVLTWRETHPEENDQRDGASVQVAQVPQAIIQGGVLLAPVIGAAGTYAQQQLQRWWESREASQENNTAGRTVISDPVPDLPPDEPPEVEQKEKILPVDEEFQTFRGRPMVEVLVDEPLIFEIVSDELLDAMIVESRGNALTQEGNKAIARAGEEVIGEFGPDAKFEHYAGAFDKDRKRLKEKYLPNVPDGERLGSSRADVSARVSISPDSPTIELHINSGKTLKDGTTLDADERYKLSNMARNLSKDENARVLGLPKLLPGMDIEDYKERMRTRLREAVQEIADQSAKK
jgi:hypothetical protein